MKIFLWNKNIGLSIMFELFLPHEKPFFSVLGFKALQADNFMNCMSYQTLAQERYVKAVDNLGRHEPRAINNPMRPRYESWQEWSLRCTKISFFPLEPSLSHKDVISTRSTGLLIFDTINYVEKVQDVKNKSHIFIPSYLLGLRFCTILKNWKNHLSQKEA